ncbi:MAG: ferritin, partial [Pantoea agglomerans]
DKLALVSNSGNGLFLVDKDLGRMSTENHAE